MFNSGWNPQRWDVRAIHMARRTMQHVAPDVAQERFSRIFEGDEIKLSA